eukprot:GFUD01032724.1.p1 GENE.GFUD01032724.1~~GFUD01032724.1.p1  ORF type:complete len:547 (+),score=100.67 GFUD01032724.1:119-1759(+)
MSRILGFVMEGLSRASSASLSEELSKVYSPITIAIFILTIILVKIAQIIRTNQRLPPGPSGYPYLGMLPKIKKEFHLQLFDYSKSFGKIFSLKMGNQLIVVLSDHKLIKSAFGKSEFAARPKTEFGNMLGGYGIINSEGQLWKNQRRFLHQQKFGMKHWGSGSEQMETRVSQEVHYLLNSIREEKTNPMNPAPILNCAISNVICSIIMSTRFHHNDKKFKRFMHLFDEGFRLFNLTGAMIFIPVLKHLPGTSNALTEIKKNRDEMVEFVRFIIQEHKETLDPEAPRDLVDSYLLEIENAKTAGNMDQVFDSMDPELQLEQIILDIFSAGVETLKTTLQWAILFMIHNPEVRKKVQAELSSVVEPDRLPCTDDMPLLPYTRATIYEVMRRSTVVPMGTTHATDRTVELEGHLIPKNTHVIPLLHGVHMDPEVWDQPEEFRPERFLTEEGKLYKPKHFMPFGAGQRMCLGDKLAEMELQLFFSSLLHVYDLENPGSDLPSLQGFTGVTVSPQDFEVNFIPRNIEALNSSESKSRTEAWSHHVRIFGSS